MKRRIRWRVLAPVTSIALVAPVALALGACFGTTWKPLPPGHSPARDKVALVGTIEIVPPGHLLALRAPPARVDVKDERDAAIEAATAAGHAELASQPGTTRLAVPMMH